MHASRRRTIGFLSAMTASAVLGSPGAFAGEYPERPITLVVQAAAGGAADFAARIVAQKLGTILGVPVVVENLPAAGGVVAVRRVTGAQRDGYTLLAYGTKSAIAESLFKARPYDLSKDLVPVGIIGSVDLAWVVGQKSPFKTVGDLVADIKTRQDKVTVGVGDTVGGIQHLSAELVKASLKANFLIVPYGSASKLTVAVRSGEVDAAFELLPPMMPQIKAGEVRALATSGRQRSPDLPEVPTLEEAGISNAEMTTWSMIAAPSGTPEAVIARLNSAMNQAMAQPDLQTALRGGGSIPAASASPADARLVMNGQISKWREAVKLAKVPLQ